MSTTADLTGRPWAKLSEVKAGDTLIPDAGFTCIEAGRLVLIESDGGLHFKFRDGYHHIGEGEHLIGLYKP